MRRIWAIILLAGFLMMGTYHSGAGSDEALKGTITMSGAWALYPLAVKWAEEFRKVHPGVRMDISAGGAGKGMADALSGVVDIGKVSRDIYPEEIKRGAWYVAVAKDAVVPVMNSMNPAFQDILEKGLTKKKAHAIWVTEEISEWEEVSGPKVRGRINVYTRSDACGAAETWAEFMGVKQEDLSGVGVYGDPGLASAVSSDVYGIGFNNVNFAYDMRTGEQVPGIRIIPLDVNNNGIIDPEEDFYKNRKEIIAAIAQGRYPSPPARELYFVCRGNPENKAVREFLRWVLTDGQEFALESGYVRLSPEAVREGLAKLEIR
ncbi:MAG: PstS family phosphate ABC transporter substrate-binding protein [Candidatus Omnitrophota bacterium]